MGMDEMRVIGEDKWDHELWDIEHATPPAPGVAEAQARDGLMQTVSATPPPPKFFFLFGQNDHWVADHCRDLFIASRRTDGKQPVTEGTSNRDDETPGGTEAIAPSSTRIIVDKGKLPHAFCIHHSETVSEMVHRWLCELYPSK